MNWRSRACRCLSFVALSIPLACAGTEPSAGPCWLSWPLSLAKTGRVGFTLLPPSVTGVTFTNLLSEERSLTNQVLLNGSGVAAGDVDGDGRVDLFFCRLGGPNRLYRNLGNWRFEDWTEPAGVGGAGLDATGAVLADVDGDGDLDLLVNSLAGGTHLFLNDGRGHFSPSPKCPLLNPAGAGTSLALADMDGDGWLDLYIANYRPMFFFLDKAETRYSIRMVAGQPQVTALDGRPLTDPEFTNRFVFQVQTVNGRMTLSKEELGEVDALYHNDGAGGFTPVSFTGGAFTDEDGRVLTSPPRDWGLSVMFRDLNGDGWPDLYVCNDFRTPDRIWINDGQGHFHALPRLAIRQTSLSSMAVDVADINRDGWFDLFTGDMLGVDHLNRLRQKTDLRPESLPPGAIENRPQFSRNMLQLSRGDGTFAEIAQFSGLEASDWTWTSLFLDVDLDGYEDLLVANGFERDTMNQDAQRQIEVLSRQQPLRPREKMNLRRLFPRLSTPNLAFRNLGNGQFTNVSAAWGFDTPVISQGMCLADLDNDGDLDVIVNNLNAPAGLYRNDTPAPRIAVRLKGLPPNTRGIGARIEVLGGPVYQSQEMICGGRYCSSDDPMRTFATGSATNRLTLVVTWRSGRRSLVPAAAPNRLYEIDEAGSLDSGAFAQAWPALPAELESALHPGHARHERRPARPAFEEVSGKLNHRHHEEAFDDFARQPLLPHQLSQLGPGVCWTDLDHDGWEDLVIGAGRGGHLAAFQNTGRGGFKPISAPFSLESVTRDQLGIVSWDKSKSTTELLIASSSYEDGRADEPAAIGLDFTPSNLNPVRSSGPADNRSLDAAPSPTIPGSTSAAGPLALADLDGSGTLELFVGGRVVPGRFPEPASSRLFRAQPDGFVLDTANTAALDGVGMVSGAVFSDLDGDGFPELILACDWGPICVFKNVHGRLTEATHSLGLDRFVGWWNGVNVGDFDGDGRMDLVVSNWGRNSRYEPFRVQPLQLYYGDFNGDGGVQLLEAHVDPPRSRFVPWCRLDEAAKAMPFLQARFSTFEAFGQASLDQILGDRLSQAHRLQANWLESTVFLNRTNHFEPVVLPLEAQLAPSFAPCVGDLDGDGAEDIFLSQNFFDLPAELSRCDAGRGLWLRGDGRGHFQAVPGPESGLLIYGEQRGAALCDYDHDGRLDLVVTQNAAQTRLFHNATAHPGLRVILHGPAGNAQGIGAVLRLRFPTHLGPARETHAGSGYASQDGAVPVLALPEAPIEIEVRWPGGRTVRVPVPNGAHEVELN